MITDYKITAMIPVCHNLRRYANKVFAGLATDCFFDNKPETIQGYCIEDTNQLSLF